MALFLLRCLPPSSRLPGRRWVTASLSCSRSAPHPGLLPRLRGSVLPSPSPTIPCRTASETYGVSPLPSPSQQDADTRPRYTRPRSRGTYLSLTTQKETNQLQTHSPSLHEASRLENLQSSMRSSVPQGHERDVGYGGLKIATGRRRRTIHRGRSSSGVPHSTASSPLSLRSVHSISLLPPLCLLRSASFKRPHQLHAGRSPAGSLLAWRRLLSSSPSSSSRDSLKPHSPSSSSSSGSATPASPSDDAPTSRSSPSPSQPPCSSCSCPVSSPSATSPSSAPSAVSPSHSVALGLKAISQRDAELHGSALEAMMSAAMKEKEEKALHAERYKGIELHPGREGTPVDRYGPPRDPSSLLIEPHKLTQEEQFFQKIFAGKCLPWIFFLCMLSAPIALVRYHVRRLEERKAFTKEVAQDLAQASHVDFFRLCANFGELRDVIEQPVHTFICYFHPKTLSSHVILPLLRDVSELFRRLGVRASIAAVDISDRHATPAHVYRVFPSALTPHGQILLPFAYEGQQPAVIPFEGPWTASGIVRALADQVPAAASALDFTQKVEDTTEDLRDCLFSLAFLDGFSEEGEKEDQVPKDRQVGAGGGRGQASESPRPGTPSRDDILSERNPVEVIARLKTVGETLQTAIRACETARARLREERCKKQRVD